MRKGILASLAIAAALCMSALSASAVSPDATAPAVMAQASTEKQPAATTAMAAVCVEREAYGLGAPAIAARSGAYDRMSPLGLAPRDSEGTATTRERWRS